MSASQLIQITRTPFKNGRVPWVYIAGPFTADEDCTHKHFIDLAREVHMNLTMAFHRAKEGAVILCPHTMGAGLEDTATPEWWYSSTMSMLEACDAVVLTRPFASREVQESDGTLKEVAWADLTNMLVVEAPVEAGSGWEAECYAAIVRRILARNEYEVVDE